MLNQETIELVQSTVPLLAKHGQEITQKFYGRLFTAHPDLKNIFNMNNQKYGNQPRALADTVFAYASNVNDVANLAHAVKRIAHKHISLGIKPKQYPIVGKFLLAAIQDVLMLPDNHPTLIAWQDAYNYLADIFMDTEESLYQAGEKTAGGWRGFRHFIIDNIIAETADVKSFYLTPKDNAGIPLYKGGQYIGIKVKTHDSAFEQIRQYSLSGQSGQNYLRITVRCDPKGIVSNYLHQCVKGDAVLVQVPSGVFTLDTHAKKHVFIAGGVGITPLLSMLYEAIASSVPADHILFIQCQRDQDQQILKEELAVLHQQTGFYYKTNFNDSDEGDYRGYLDTGILNKWFNEYEFMPKANTAVYFCGPSPFMSLLKGCCLSLGFNEGAIHYEMFGPTTAI